MPFNDHRLPVRRVARRGFALRRADNQLCLDTAAPQRNPDGEVVLQVRVVSRPSRRLPLPARLFARALQKHAHTLGLKSFANAVRNTSPDARGLALQ